MNSVILYDLRSEPYRESIIKALDKLFKGRYSKAYLKPLGRFGKTTARLYTMRVEQKRSLSVAYVCKVDTTKNITREMNNTEKVQHYFKLLPAFEYSDPNILVYKDAGDLDLKTLLDGCVHYSSVAIPVRRRVDRPRKIIEIALKGLPSPDHPKKTIEIKEGFKYYLRDNIGIKHFEFYSQHKNTVGVEEKFSWEDLLKRIRLFLDLKIEFAMGPIHGDLHPSNIMVDTSNNDSVKLIDLAWANKNGISAIDYAMMENSLHYMWAPFWLPEYFWETIDEFTLKRIEVNSSQKESFLKSFSDDLCLCEWGKAIWNMISTVRTAVVENKIDTIQFFVARTALLLGQAKFESYSPPLIGPQLWRLLNAIDSCSK